MGFGRLILLGVSALSQSAGHHGFFNKMAAARLGNLGLIYLNPEA